MRKLQTWMSNDETHVDCNCFALTAICHGNSQGHLKDKNRNKAWDIEMLVGYLSDVETLKGKPKIIVIQSCRGSMYCTIYCSI